MSQSQPAPFLYSDGVTHSPRTDVDPPPKSTRSDGLDASGQAATDGDRTDGIPEQHHQDSPPAHEWLNWIAHHSRFLWAGIELPSFRLQAINPALQHLLGVNSEMDRGDQNPSETPPGLDLLNLLSEADQTALRRLYRRHVLHHLLHPHYSTELPLQRLLDESVIVTLPDPSGLPSVQVELWLRSDRLQVTPSGSLQAELDQLGLHPDLNPQAPPEVGLHPDQLADLESRLNLDRYQISGWLLLEGLEVTARQTVHDLIQLLIDRESVLQPEKFNRVNALMRSLFRADNSLILSAETEQARLFMDLDQNEWQVKTYPLKSLQTSHLLKAAAANQVINLPDLQVDCPSDCELAIRETGARSLLIIPLVMKSTLQQDTPQSKLVGIVGLTSDRPYQFDSVDCRHAQSLIPALTAALRQAIQRRFTNIHPAVEWRFIQEAERRSWGLPPEAIVFEEVYPLYGISDIRGSSDERNRAIQSDLLEQFQLGLNLSQAVYQATQSTFCEQLQLDLQEHIAQLQEGVTVDAEVSLTRYLKEHLESHFAYFSQCGPEAQTAIASYQAACDPVHNCVYKARAHYDQTIQHINTLLREVWARCQDRMQQIVQHYCDIETTDGIDHMIYAGASIDPNFCAFHLRSLRYEQLRAVCDCARAAFSLKERFDTHLEVTHLVLVQVTTVDIFHDETTERLFDVRGTRDTRYEIVKKRIDKALDSTTRTRITQPGMLTLVYSTPEEWEEYRQYFRYLQREGWIDQEIQFGAIEPLQGVTGLKFARVRILAGRENLE